MASASWIGTAIGLRISSPPATTASSYSNRRWEVNPGTSGPALTRRVRIAGRARSASAPWAATASSPRSSRGTDAVVYTAGDSEGGLWLREVIGTEFEGGHALIAVDLNDDGYDEIVAGGRGGDWALMIYRYLPSSDSWEKIPLDIGGVAVSGLYISDINGDGALDIVAIGGATDNVVFYENSR